MTKETMIKALWRKGNDTGTGYAVGSATDDIDKIQGLGELVFPSDGPDGVAVYRKGGALVAVGDAHGPWAVDLPPDALGPTIKVTSFNGSEVELPATTQAWIPTHAATHAPRMGTTDMLGAAEVEHYGTLADACPGEEVHVLADCETPEGHAVYERVTVDMPEIRIKDVRKYNLPRESVAVVDFRYRQDRSAVLVRDETGRYTTTWTHAPRDWLSSSFGLTSYEIDAILEAVQSAVAS